MLVSLKEAIHEGIPPGSSEAGNGREPLSLPGLAARPATVPDPSTWVLGEGQRAGKLGDVGKTAIGPATEVRDGFGPDRRRCWRK